ncbi:MAG TPA: hypothetical protein PLU22_02420 [Polyangiaceae bacterium]|nr:hypothetical protein [Polyangiaceae bacterium]
MTHPCVLHCRWETAAGLALLSPLVGLGCSPPLDALGVEEVVTEQRVRTLDDDDIADKHPTYDPARTIDEDFDGCTFTLNKSASVTRLSITELEGDDAALAGRIFPTRTEALAALGARPVIPSMEVVNGALKPFNDGLYAAIELAAEDGSSGSPIAKAALFRELLAALVERSQSGPASDRASATRAATDLAAAAELGGETPSAPDAILDAVPELVGEFEANPGLSRPIGFYTWLPALERIFARDRFLQSAGDRPSAIGDFAAAALVLDGDPTLREQYQRTLDLYAGLTNPLVSYTPLDLVPHLDGDSLANVDGIATSFTGAHPDFGFDNCEVRLAYLPASSSPETELFQSIFCDGGPPDNFIDTLIETIRSGAVDLTPTEASGWYDRQLYALETLLLPERAAESDHLLLTREYKEKLVETFKSLITQTRETHVKQLAIATMDGAPPSEVDVYPLLPIEPFPTFYLRTARAYAFLHQLLRSVMGEEFLAAAGRVLEDGSRHPTPLGEELTEQTNLLYGLSVVAARSIGMAPEITAEELADTTSEAVEALARDWLASWRDDADVARDPRVIVPVARVDEVWSYWAVVGVKVFRMRAEFYPGYEPEVVNAWCTLKDFVPFEPYLLMEQMVEVKRTGTPLTRDELREICDAHDTVEAITAALGNVE